jgi:sugar lactone lactonase YvrE
MMSGFLALILIISGVPMAISANTPTNYTYSYNEWQLPVPSPDAYRVTAFMLGEDIGVGHFNNPRDLHVWGDLLYIADTGNNRIVVVRINDNASFEAVKVVSEVVINGEPSAFNRPQGIFVSDWEGTRGHIWVADTANQRIVHLDENWDFVMEIKHPGTMGSTMFEHMDFLPNKLAVDFSGRLFVQVTHVNRGLMEFDRNGNFAAYMGAPDVSVSPIERFWRSVATREQRERRILNVPVEYNNVTIDRYGFLYVTTTSADIEPVRRLNAMGSDIMIRNGFADPVGDLWWGTGAGIGGRSELIDTAVLPNNTYVVFDRNRGRMFSYDSQGEMLYAWGGRGSREGFFQLPTALVNQGYTLFALDAVTAAVTRFDLTEYGSLINEALAMYQRGQYEESYDIWNEVLRINGNFGLAYIGLARALLRQGRFREAMDYFRHQNDGPNYGRAFGFYRREWMEANFWMFVVAVGIIFIVPPVVKKVIKIRREILDS